jgi:ribonuclease I
MPRMSSARHRPAPARLLAFVLSLLAVAGARATSLTAARHADFAHYTFALTWQPGFCGTAGGCLRDQPHDVLIGLHGLWASRPRSLIERGISAPQWWSRGCDYYHHSDLAPRLSHATLQRLDRVMPHLQDGLLRHEYDKHVQCFGFDAQEFFDTELRMRRQVLDSTFGRYLIVSARDHVVGRTAVIDAFLRAFHTNQPAALQLRCERDARGNEVLTQLWITLHADALPRFPRGGSLMNAPIAQDNCPARFRVPGWR